MQFRRALHLQLETAAEHRVPVAFLSGKFQQVVWGDKAAEMALNVELQWNINCPEAELREQPELHLTAAAHIPLLPTK